MQVCLQSPDRLQFWWNTQKLSIYHARGCCNPELYCLTRCGFFWSQYSSLTHLEASPQKCCGEGFSCLTTIAMESWTWENKLEWYTKWWGSGYSKGDENRGWRSRCIDARSCMHQYNFMYCGSLWSQGSRSDSLRFKIWHQFLAVYQSMYS